MHCTEMPTSGIQIASLLYLKVLILSLSSIRQMLEYIYDDIILKYHNSFLEDYEDSDNYLQIE